MGASIKPRLAKGTRDFSPEDMRLRNYLLNTIRSTFEKYAFEQIETPAVEQLSTLTGKYGDEGDKLIFKILNSGDYLKNADGSLLEARNSDKLIPELSEKALRYDLTVPFARYVVMHRNEINFPFRRYQIQPVWRADRPQKGRYREFYQCDADVIGTDSLLVEAELIAMIDEVFQKLDIRAEVRLNSRKILQGFCEGLGLDKRFMDFTVILDKLDKKSWEELKAEFADLGLDEGQIDKVRELADFAGKALSSENLEAVSQLTTGSELAQRGVEELSEIAGHLQHLGTDFVKVSIDLSLARGLNYYTGVIIEVVAPEENMGSICGGGRYDDLTGIFGLDDVSGVGISFGIDRIYDILKAHGWTEEDTKRRILFINFGEDSLDYSLEMLSRLRKSGVSAEIYPTADKLKKQFKYADQKSMDFVVMAGSEEMKEGKFGLKNLKTGDQQSLSKDDLMDFLMTH